MTVHHADDWLTVLHGDAATELRTLDAESVHCVVTSPPYWGLRDYGTATWVGGDEACDHLDGPLVSSSSTLAGYTSENIKLRTNGVPFKGACGKCGAVREDGQLGLEPTPEAYVAGLVDVFREVRRALRSDGTVWLNLGDSYAAERGGTHQPAESLAGGRHGKTVDGQRVNRGRADGYSPSRNARALGLKHKDLVGIPWMVAFALRADGWYLRSDIIWAKPNPMPESVTDRPTKSHEYLFLLAKSARYYFDADAVREGATYAGPNGAQHSPYGQGFTRRSDKQAASVAVGVGNGHHVAGFNDRWDHSELNGSAPLRRNIRSVWTVASQPYPGAHFATFPQKLVEPCILAGCPEGGVVLDPFAGTGTTGLVAQRLSRRAVLIDLSIDYLGQLMDRNRDIPLGLGA